MVRGKAACLVDAGYCDENVGVAHLSRGLFFCRGRSGPSGRGRALGVKRQETGDRGGGKVDLQLPTMCVCYNLPVGCSAVFEFG